MKKFILLLTFAAMLLTACSEKTASDVEQIPTENSTSAAENTTKYDPFAVPEKDSATAGAFEFGVNWQEDSEFVLDFAPTVTFEYYIENSSSDSDFGLLIFVNGFRQPYRTDSDSNDKILHIFNVGEDETKTQKIEFEPITGDIGDELSVEIMTMFQPNFVKKENNNYEFHHKIHSIFPSSMTVTENTGKNPPEVCTVYDEEPITDELRQKYNTMSSTGSYGGNSLDDIVYIEVLKNGVLYTPADCLNGDTDMTPFTMNDTVTLCMYGKDSCKYRVSMYLNHELVKGAFDGKDYIDITASRDSLSKKEINMQGLGLTPDEYNHLYFIAVPFYTNGNYNERMIIKSDSVTLIDPIE